MRVVSIAPFAYLPTWSRVRAKVASDRELDKWIAAGTFTNAQSKPAPWQTASPDQILADLNAMYEEGVALLRGGTSRLRVGCKECQRYHARGECLE